MIFERTTWIYCETFFCNIKYIYICQKAFHHVFDAPRGFESTPRESRTLGESRQRRRNQTRRDWDYERQTPKRNTNTLRMRVVSPRPATYRRSREFVEKVVGMMSGP